MFLFQCVKYLTFERTPEWQEMYDRLCNETDFLYFLQRERKGLKSASFSLVAFSLCFWWVIFQMRIYTFPTIILAIFFTAITILYILNIYCYIPTEIVETKIYCKEKAYRSPNATANKKIKDRNIELRHMYYIYTTEDGRKCIDMTDRVLGEDQVYLDEEVVYRFSGHNSDFDYVLPKIIEE